MRVCKEGFSLALGCVDRHNMVSVAVGIRAVRTPNVLNSLCLVTVLEGSHLSSFSLSERCTVPVMDDAEHIIQVGWPDSMTTHLYENEDTNTRVLLAASYYRDPYYVI